MYFDARAAKALLPGHHIVVQGCPGLRLIASESRKTWTYRYRSPVDDALRQVKIGLWPAMTPVDAAGEWKRLRDLRETGVDPRLAKKQEREEQIAEVVAAAQGEYTLGQMVEHYWRGYLEVNREPRGAKAVGQRLANAMKPWFDRAAESTSRALVFEIVGSLMKTPVVAKSVKTEMTAAWRFAMEAGRVSDELPNWWAEKTSHKFRSKGALRAGEHKGTAKRVLKDYELTTLLVEDLALFSTQVQDFLTIQLWTCTRGAEICQMRRSQISKEADGWWWTVPKSEMKGRNVEAAYDLRVPLEGRAREIVERLLARTSPDVPWLFPSKSKQGLIRGQSQTYMQSKVHYMQPYSNARKDHVRKRLQITHWSPHDLRRTGRTMLAAMVCPHEVGEAILGHVLPGVAGDYNLYRYDAERRVWLKRLSDRLSELALQGRPLLAA